MTHQKKKWYLYLVCAAPDIIHSNTIDGNNAHGSRVGQSFGHYTMSIGLPSHHYVRNFVSQYDLLVWIFFLSRSRSCFSFLFYSSLNTSDIFIQLLLLSSIHFVLMYIWLKYNSTRNDSLLFVWFFLLFLFKESPMCNLTLIFEYRLWYILFSFFIFFPFFSLFSHQLTQDAIGKYNMEYDNFEKQIWTQW